tara:strand:- start:9634 stop:10233 length:600 start_codon:yes stop_codon:yes gene_type:complete
MSEFKSFNHTAEHYTQHDVQLVGGTETISVRTPNGRQITFAFLPYERGIGVEPQCVDIVYHHNGDTIGTGVDNQTPVQAPIVFGKGTTPYKYDSNAAHKPSIVTVLMEENIRMLSDCDADERKHWKLEYSIEVGDAVARALQTSDGADEILVFSGETQRREWMTYYATEERAREWFEARKDLFAGKDPQLVEVKDEEGE